MAVPFRPSQMPFGPWERDVPWREPDEPIWPPPPPLDPVAWAINTQVTFDPDVPLDPSQIDDVRGYPESSTPGVYEPGSSTWIYDPVQRVYRQSVPGDWPPHGAGRVVPAQPDPNRPGYFRPDPTYIPVRNPGPARR